MAKTRNQYRPSDVSPPWDTLQESLEVKGWSSADLASRAGVSKDEIDGLLTGSATMTLEVAEGLERAFGVPARFWLNRERAYRESLEKGPSRIPVG